VPGDGLAAQPAFIYEGRASRCEVDSGWGRLDFAANRCHAQGGTVELRTYCGARHFFAPEWCLCGGAHVTLVRASGSPLLREGNPGMSQKQEGEREKREEESGKLIRCTDGRRCNMVLVWRAGAALQHRGGESGCKRWAASCSRNDR